ncbi:MAG: orotate phosphoribosyltransferase [Promethearchaeota archaeon]
MQWLKQKKIIAKQIIRELYSKEMIQTWFKHKPEGWTLHSGIWSPIYINLRYLPSHPNLFKTTISALNSIIKFECPDITYIVGIATAGIPIAAALATEALMPMGYTRKIQNVTSPEQFQKQIEKYGSHKLVEGLFKNGDNILLVDDLVTKMSSKLIAIKQVEKELKNRNIKADCNNLLVVLDREQGAEEYAKQYGLHLYSLIKLKSEGLQWLKDLLNPIEYNVLNDYLNDYTKFQNKQIQENLKNKSSAK